MLPAADSAGQPFAGRSFSANPFQGDSGERDPELALALEAFGEVLSTPAATRSTQELAASWRALVEVLRSVRLLTPLIAEAGDFGFTETGAVVEKTQELAVVHVEGPDGRPVLPVFSDVRTLSAWNSSARPVPVDGQRAALAAAAEGLDLMVLDASASHSIIVRRSALKAIATGEKYSPPWVDNTVAEHIASGLESAVPFIKKHRILAGDPSQTLAGPEVVVAVGVPVGFDPEELRGALSLVSDRWSQNDVLVSSCDGIGIRVLPA
jgi:hypothetical protein